MAVVFTRGTNRVDTNIDNGVKRYSLDPNLQISGVAGDNVLYFSYGPLGNDYSASTVNNYLLSFSVLDISGRPNDNPVDVADWLATTYFFGNDYGGGGAPGTGLATEAKQDLAISELQDVEAAVLANTAKIKGSDVTVAHDSKEVVRYVGGGLDGKMSYIRYKVGGRIIGTEVARKTLYYDGNFKLQYTEVT